MKYYYVVLFIQVKRHRTVFKLIVLKTLLKKYSEPIY